MTAANKARVLTRWGAVGLMATAVLTATAGGFAQSYAGLYNWAKEHGLSGWKADSFPLLVDLFIIVGELGLFLLALDAYVVRRKRIMSWLDFFLPLFIALAGWTASLIFNVGHVMNHEFSYQATAAVPPIVSMLGLFVLLRTMHRYVSSLDAEQEEQAREQRAIAAPAPITLQHITVVPLRISAQPVAKELGSPKPAVAAAPAAAPTPARAASTASQETATAANVEAKPVPAPEPVQAATHASSSVTASASGHGGSVNGHSAVATESSRRWSDPDDTAVDIPAVSQPDPETLRAVVIDVLGRHHGDVAATMDELRSEGYVVEKDSVTKTRENHWFPYAVYRLLARHLGDGDLVRKDLAAQGIEFDPEALDALVRSWRG